MKALVLLRLICEMGTHLQACTIADELKVPSLRLRQGCTLGPDQATPNWPLLLIGLLLPSLLSFPPASITLYKALPRPPEPTLAFQVSEKHVRLSQTSVSFCYL